MCNYLRYFCKIWNSGTKFFDIPKYKKPFRILRYLILWMPFKNVWTIFLQLVCSLLFLFFDDDELMTLISLLFWWLSVNSISILSSWCFWSTSEPRGALHHSPLQTLKMKKCKAKLRNFSKSKLVLASIRGSPRILKFWLPRKLFAYATEMKYLVWGWFSCLVFSRGSKISIASLLLLIFVSAHICFSVRTTIQQNNWYGKVRYYGTNSVLCYYLRYLVKYGIPIRYFFGTQWLFLRDRKNYFSDYFYVTLKITFAIRFYVTSRKKLRTSFTWP